MDANNKLQWVNRGTNSPPTSGENNFYWLFSYDANGNAIHRERRDDQGLFRSFDLKWDANDNLRVANQQGVNWFNATYNGDGLRVHKQDIFTPTHDYTWGLGGVLYDAANNTTTTPGVSQNVNGTDQFFASDWLGSTRYLTDSTGNTAPSLFRYDAFGGRTVTGSGNWSPTESLFAGEWGYQTEWSNYNEPGLGLQYLQNRYYDPGVGRFLSADPLSFLAGPNLYQYVDNDPVNGVDPEGLQFRGAPDPFDTEAPSAAYGHDARNRPFRAKASKIGNWLKGCTEVLASFNPLTSAGIGLNKLKERKYGEAILYFLPLVGHSLGAAGEAAGSLRSLTIAEIKAKYLNGEQLQLIQQFFGRSNPGAAARAANFEIPAGLTRESLEAYAEVATRAIAAGKDKLGVQAERLDLINRALDMLK